MRNLTPQTVIAAAATHHLSGGVVVLAVLVLVAWWLIRAYFKPSADCRRCGGTGHNLATRISGSTKRRGRCGKCGGTGSRQTLGSKAVHKAVRSARRRKG